MWLFIANRVEFVKAHSRVFICAALNSFREYVSICWAWLWPERLVYIFSLNIPQLLTPGSKVWAICLNFFLFSIKLVLIFLKSFLADLVVRFLTLSSQSSFLALTWLLSDIGLPLRWVDVKIKVFGKIFFPISHRVSIDLWSSSLVLHSAP
jgi:hypothetical protein